MLGNTSDCLHLRGVLDTRRNHWKRKEEKRTEQDCTLLICCCLAFLEFMLFCSLLKFIPSFYKVCTSLLHYPYLDFRLLLTSLGFVHSLSLLLVSLRFDY